VKGCQRSFRKLFPTADIKNLDGSRKHCHSHMFRDTLALELLLAGVPIDQVSVPLGHRSVKMTEKQYLPWVKARQKQLTASVRRAWFPEVRKSPMPRTANSVEQEVTSTLPAIKFYSLELYNWVNSRITHPLLYV
jgi:integrase/recombinase XerD